MNFKKTIVIPVVCTIALTGMIPLSSSPSTAYASSENTQTVSLKYSDVTVANADQVDVQRKETPNSVTINVYDKQTGTLLNTYGEVVRPYTPAGISVNAGEYSIMTRFTEKNEGGGIITRLEVQLQLYNSGSFRQINQILSKNFFVKTSGPTLNIANFSAISTSGKYPTTSISSVGSGTLEVKGSTANSLGVSVDILKSAGFNINYTTTKEWVARKFVTSTLSVDI